MKYRIVAINEKEEPVQVICEDRDLVYLDQIIEMRDGTCWVGSSCCSMMIQQVK